MESLYHLKKLGWAGLANLGINVRVSSIRFQMRWECKWQRARASDMTYRFIIKKSFLSWYQWYTARRHCHQVLYVSNTSMMFSIRWLFTMQYDSAKKPGKFGKFMDVANTVISRLLTKYPTFFLPRLLRLFTCLSMITWILVRKKPTFHQNYKVNNLEWRVFLAWNYANKLSSSYQGVLYMGGILN